MRLISLANSFLDLRGLPCPQNYVRCCLALEDLLPEDFLEVYLDKGEPMEMVIPSLLEKGHKVEIIDEQMNWVQIIVACSGR